MLDEKTPLLKRATSQHKTSTQDCTHVSIPKRISGAVVGTLRVVVSTVLAPGHWVIACFYDEKGRFSAFLPFYRIGSALSRRQRRRKVLDLLPEQSEDRGANNGRPRRKSLRQHQAKHSRQNESLSSTPSMVPKALVDENQHLEEISDKRFHSSHVRSLSTSSTGSEDSETSRPKRSIRINTFNEDNLRQRKQRREEQKEYRISNSPSNMLQPALTVDSIKSPINPVSSSRLTGYPRTPAPPRPLVPRRRPSYLDTPSSSDLQKTLVIDLDETLIHSMAKGGRMSTGHMVEVKLSSPVGAGGAVLGPQVPILYYVHKRPHCDVFLQKVRNCLNRVV